MSNRRTAVVCALLYLATARSVFAQRDLYWDRLDVEARLDDAGRLNVTETHAMVFTGDWNGGERTFNLRPGQQLIFTGMSRLVDGDLRALREDGRLANVDDYARTDLRTVRWRSRLGSAPRFARTPLTYVLRYQMSGVLAGSGDRFVLNHDFAFPERAGMIRRFAVRLVLDHVWQPPVPVRPEYTASGLEPGRGYVLTIPLRYTGTGRPVSLQGLSGQVVWIALAAVLGGTAIAVLAFFRRETSYGRFTPVTIDGVDDRWIAERILKYPAEVVG